MSWIWLGVVISLLLIEYMSRNLTAICFAISGLISWIMTYFMDKYNIQLAVFLIVGLFLILIIRPILIKVLCKRNIAFGRRLAEQMNWKFDQEEKKDEIKRSQSAKDVRKKKKR